MVNERISEFLKGWLKRREARLRTVQSRSSLGKAQQTGKQAGNTAKAA
jgi:ribosome modulation factor